VQSRNRPTKVGSGASLITRNVSEAKPFPEGYKGLLPHDGRSSDMDSLPHLSTMRLLET